MSAPEAAALRRALAQLAPSAPAPATAWGGQLVELAAAARGARCSCAATWVAARQREGGLTAWVQPVNGGLYPPDLAACGVDLAALAVVHLPPTAGPMAPARAVEILLGSGAFAGVVLDVVAGAPPRPQVWLQRLAQQARRQGSGLLLLTQLGAQPRPLGPGIAAHLQPQCPAVPQAAGLYPLQTVPLRPRDASRVWPTELRQAPVGLAGGWPADL